MRWEHSWKPEFWTLKLWPCYTFPWIKWSPKTLLLLPVQEGAWTRLSPRFYRQWFMSRVSLYSLDVFIPTTQSVTLCSKHRLCQWVTNHRVVTSMGLHKDCLFFKILSYIFMNIPLACLILAWIAILYIFKFPVVYQLMCPWLSQNLQWVLSKEYSTVMGIAPRIHMTSQRTVTSLAIMTCCQSETVHPPPSKRTVAAAAAAAVNDTKDHWVATGPLSRTAVRFFSILKFATLCEC